MARSHLSAEESAQLEAFNIKQQREGLDVHERQSRDDLLRQYERTVLIRVEAVGLLQERGVEVATSANGASARTLSEKAAQVLLSIKRDV